MLGRRLEDDGGHATSFGRAATENNGITRPSSHSGSWTHVKKGKPVGRKNRSDMDNTIPKQTKTGRERKGGDNAIAAGKKRAVDKIIDAVDAVRGSEALQAQARHDALEHPRLQKRAKKWMRITTMRSLSLSSKTGGMDS